MKFPQEFIDRVRDANDLTEIVGQYAELKGTGNRVTCQCPFPDHNDRSPSFSISTDKQLYHCFGCNRGGNVFTFLQTFSGLTFPDVILYLARRASLPIPMAEEALESHAALQEQKDTLLRSNKAAADFYHERLKGLPIGHPAKLYLKRRGLDEESVEKFRLGVAPGSPILNDGGFDFLRNRLVFPILAPTGDIIGFGGRILDDGTPKYINSSDSPVFKKGHVLYGLHETGRFIRSQNSAILVEGYMDAISLYSAGIKNVAAILGTAFTAEHTKILRRYTSNVTMLLDGDAAGINGAERSLPILLEAGLLPKGYILPDEMDPDDFLKARGSDLLQTEILRAQDLFTLLLHRQWLKTYNGSATSKVQVVEHVAKILSRARDSKLVELYALELARELDVGLAWIKKALANQTTGSVNQAKTNVSERVDAESVNSQDTVILKGTPRAEAVVLSLLLHHEYLLEDLIKENPENLIGILTSPGVRQILSSAIERYLRQPGCFAALATSFVSMVDDPSVLSIVLSLDCDAAKGIERKLLDDYVKVIRKRSLKNQAKELAKNLKRDPSTPKLEEFMRLLKERFDLED